LGFLPFAIAFVSNVGSDSADFYDPSMAVNDTGTPTYQSYWLENGGANRTADYAAQFPTYPDYFTSCAYITDGWCRGENPAGVHRQYLSTGAAFAVDWRTPAPSTLVSQSHYAASDGSHYLGSSGYQEFAWQFGSEYFPLFPQGEALDALRLTFVNHNAAYTCSYSEFVNVEFKGELTFIHDGQTKSFGDFKFKESNKFEHSVYDFNTGLWNDVCQFGFDLEFDFTGFESLELKSFNNGDWLNTTMQVSLTDFERADGQSFSNTQLPFAGDNKFAFSVEHVEMNSITAGFFIKTSTLVLSLIIFALGVASTQQWDPFKSLIGGILP
tara:strand:+ start:1340 stop:2317 length:978 start_codon:yes stop_codon:yes gene_type:complete